MAFDPVHADRVFETTTSTGTPSVTLDGAETGYQSFNTGIGSGGKCFYAIVDTSAGDWEHGEGTFNGSGLDRDNVISSSNSDDFVVFGAGTKNVFCSPGSRAFMEVGCKLYRSAVQSIVNNTLTLVSFDTEVWDPFGMHSGATSPGLVSIAVPGRYQVEVSVAWENFATGTYRDAMIYKNGNLIQIGRVAPMSVGENHGTQQLVECAANDYLEFWVAHDRGGSANIGGTSWYKGGMTVQRLTT